MSFSPEQPSSSLPPAPDLAESAPVESGRYQPLSSLAMTSLVLAIVLSLVLVGGAIIAMFSRTPFLLPPWVLLLAAGVVVLAWVARTQIVNSEGALSGQAATTWAMGLCMVLAPLYGAYYAATYFAVTIQAQDYSMKWLTQLTEGNVENAFWMTLPATQRPPENQRSRDALEVQHDQPGPTGPGEFTGFRQSEATRLLGNAGKGARVELVNLNNWAFEQGGYEVTGTYRVHTRLATFDVVVTAQGILASVGDQRKRQWHIVNKDSGRAHEIPVQFTPEGNEFNSAAAMGFHFFNQIIRALMEKKTEAALTLALGPDAKEEAARKRWFTGDLVDDDGTRFWAAPGVREALVKQVRTAFTEGLASGVNPGVRWVPAARSTPLFTELEGGDYLLGYDFQVTLPAPKPGELPHTVNAIAQVRFKKDAKGPRVERLERIDLIDGRSVPVPSGSQG